MKLLGDKATAQFLLDLAHSSKPQREQLKDETKWVFTADQSEEHRIAMRMWSRRLAVNGFPIEHMLQDPRIAILGLPETLLAPGERKVSTTQMDVPNALFRGSFLFVWTEQCGSVVIHDLFVGKDKQFDSLLAIPVEMFSILSCASEMNIDTARSGQDIKIDVQNALGDQSTKVRAAIFGRVVVLKPGEMP